MTSTKNRKKQGKDNDGNKLWEDNLEQICKEILFKNINLFGRWILLLQPLPSMYGIKKGEQFLQSTNAKTSSI